MRWNEVIHPWRVLDSAHFCLDLPDSAHFHWIRPRQCTCANIGRENAKDMSIAAKIPRGSREPHPAPQRLSDPRQPLNQFAIRPGSADPNEIVVGTPYSNRDCRGGAVFAVGVGAPYSRRPCGSHRLWPIRAGIIIVRETPKNVRDAQEIPRDSRETQPALKGP
jgi:hypothetical protein